MAEPLIAHVLRGRTVIIVHEDRFRGEYLAEVLRGADAIVTGPAGSPSAAIDLIVLAEPPAAMVLSSSVTGSGALFERASAKGLATLLVDQPQSMPRTGVATLPFLSSPYAGFQVVDALARMLLIEDLREEQRGCPCPLSY